LIASFGADAIRSSHQPQSISSVHSVECGDDFISVQHINQICGVTSESLSPASIYMPQPLAPFSWLDDELLICPDAIDDGLRRTFSALLRRSPNF
jgi:hypothetical protein